MALPIAEPFEAGLSLACKHPGGFLVGFDELMLKLRPLIGPFGDVERLSLDEILKAYLGREPANAPSVVKCGAVKSTAFVRHRLRQS